MKKIIIGKIRPHPRLVRQIETGYLNIGLVGKIKMLQQHR
jgi:hypothetical protein